MEHTSHEIAAGSSSQLWHPTCTLGYTLFHMHNGENSVGVILNLTPDGIDNISETLVGVSIDFKTHISDRNGRGRDK